ncbi:MAG: methyltransferase domain-containing protein [Planctomycetes bacterium]|nr:methyltransferase domain-containing protein [Planctomycetota bacterium]
MKKKFNILYVIDGGTNWGGAEENLLNVLRVIDRNMFSVEVCCLAGGSVAEKLKTADVCVTVLDMRNKWDYRAVLGLAFLLKRKDIHIIHTSLYASNTFGRIAAIMARTPVTVAWEHGMAYVKPRKHIFLDWLLNKFTNFIVAPSEAVKQSLVEVTGVSGEKIEVIHDSTDMSRYDTGSERAKTYITPEAGMEKLEKLYEKFIVRGILSRKKSLSKEEEELRRDWIQRRFSYGDGKFVRTPTRDYEEETMRNGLLKLLEPIPGELVLDVGCNRCGDIIFLSPTGARFIGIDFAELAVTEGKRNLRKADKDTSLMVADALCLPFKDHVFDKIYCKESLEHIPHYEAAIEEIARVLKVGGVVAITCPNWFSIHGLHRVFSELKRWALNRSAYHPCDDWRTQRVLERSLKKYGFEIKDRLGIDFLPSPMCYRLSNESQERLVKMIRFMESRFLCKLTAFGNKVGLSAVKKSDSH